MKNFITGTLAAAVVAGLAAFGFQQLNFDPGENIVAGRLAGKWMIDKEVTRLLDPNASTSEMAALEFTHDLSVLKRLQNHDTAGDIFKNRRIFGAGMMTIGRGEPFPYVLKTRGDNMNLIWFRPTDPSTDPTSPAGRVDAKAVNIGCSRDGSNDMLFLGGDKVREASACYRRKE